VTDSSLSWPWACTECYTAICAAPERVFRRQPVLALDMSVIQGSVLPVDVSARQQPTSLSQELSVWPTAFTAPGRVCLQEAVLHLICAFALHLEGVCL
jgi:hypothetical protein